MSKSGGLPSLFIGSSTESVEIGIVEHLAAPFRERFDVRPWTMGFSPGNNTLQSILDAIAAADFAIFVFAADDIREMRESRDRVTRDNVILELGIGIAKLGIDRVAVLREDGVAVPTDLAGTVDVQFTHGIDRDPALLKGSLRQASERIDVAWASHYERLRRLGDIRNDYPFGIDGALERLIMDADGLQRRLATAPPGERVAPVVFEREVDCVTAYCDGLRRVESRFWTTSFLSSGFWTGSRAEILTANTSMLERLGRTDAGARRIFLLRAPVEEQIEFEVQQQRNLVRAGCREDARRFDARLGNLESNIRSLIAAGCDVRIAHDGDELHSTLPASMAFDELDSEIALYDDFRVDVFRGGRIGRITGLEVYFARDRDFPAYLSSAMAYFGRLWESATPALDYLAQLRSRLQSEERRIDYDTNWLAKYDAQVHTLDGRLKQEEMRTSQDLVHEHGLWGRIRNYLDIGTCTARYPLALHTAMAENGRILAIDSDPECVQVARDKLVGLAAPHTELAIDVEQVDFTARELGIEGTFDLITCMMGTVSHFGWDRSSDLRDAMQFTLQRVRKLLSDRGIALISCWSDNARDTSRLLGIYSAADAGRLIQWTPSVAEMRRRVAAAGLKTRAVRSVGTRLALFACSARAADAADEGELGAS